MFLMPNPFDKFDNIERKPNPFDQFNDIQQSLPIDKSGGSRKIFDPDMDRIDSKKLQTDLNKSTKMIADALSKLADKKPKEDNGNLLAESIKQQTLLIKQMMDYKKKDWEFDVRRNEKGFIKKVYAKQI